MAERRDLRFERAGQAGCGFSASKGYGRAGRASYVHFLKIAQGSLKELETHLDVAFRVGHMSGDALEAVLGDTETVGKLINGLIRKLSEQ